MAFDIRFSTFEILTSVKIDITVSTVLKCFEPFSSVDIDVILSGQLGLDLPVELGQPTSCSEGLACWQWGTAAKLSIEQASGKVKK